jgi:SAM-dependent methyltransferase
LSESVIDVRQLIARYSTAEHVARADAYFASMPANPLLLRKPFFGLRDTPANLYGAAEILHCLNLFAGARVLDFGAGTGWFSKLLAFIGCQAVAVDVSRTALEMGRRAFAADPVANGLQIEWRVFDGERLPLEDASMDRIVCYDAFHHVADQALVLREFHRVLRPGGRAAFHEPGPAHSQIPVAQYEMRHHGVIENDIVVEEISRTAEAIGFTSATMVLAAPRAPMVPLDAYNRVVAGLATLDDAAAIVRNLVLGADNLRIFFVDKAGLEADSRHGTKLCGAVDVTITRVDADGVCGLARVTNTGSARWCRSGTERGDVSLGVKRMEGGCPHDYGRVWLSGNGVQPGETVMVEFTLPTPRDRPAELVFDLVAEHVSWFEALGSTPRIVRI